MTGLLKRVARFLLSARRDRHGLDPTRRAAAFNFDQGRRWAPSGHAKRKHLREILRSRGHRIFIEAGTYRGETVEFVANEVDRIVTVELDQSLYARASKRFSGDPRIEVRCGDATDVIPEVVAGVEHPPLIWLDGHFSGGITARGDVTEPAPEVIERLGSVAPPGTTIVVDDLRLFGSEEDFPQADELTTAARRAFPNARIRTGLDSLVIEN